MQTLLFEPDVTDTLMSLFCPCVDGRGERVQRFNSLEMGNEKKWDGHAVGVVVPWGVRKRYKIGDYVDVCFAGSDQIVQRIVQSVQHGAATCGVLHFLTGSRDVTYDVAQMRPLLGPFCTKAATSRKHPYSDLSSV